MLECKVCGTKFNAFDCPMCGCQVIAKERKRDYIPFISTDEEDADDDQI